MNSHIDTNNSFSHFMTAKDCIQSYFLHHFYIRINWFFKGINEFLFRKVPGLYLLSNQYLKEIIADEICNTLINTINSFHRNPCDKMLLDNEIQEITNILQNYTYKDFLPNIDYLLGEKSDISPISEGWQKSNTTYSYNNVHYQKILSKKLFFNDSFMEIINQCLIIFKSFINSILIGYNNHINLTYISLLLQDGRANPYTFELNRDVRHIDCLSSYDIFEEFISDIGWYSFDLVPRSGSHADYYDNIYTQLRYLYYCILEERADIIKNIGGIGSELALSMIKKLKLRAGAMIHHYYRANIHDRHLDYFYSDSSFDDINPFFERYHKRITYDLGLSYENSLLNYQKVILEYKTRGVLIPQKLIELGCVLKDVRGETRVLFYDHVMHEYCSEINSWKYSLYL